MRLALVMATGSLVKGNDFLDAALFEVGFVGSPLFKDNGGQYSSFCQVHLAVAKVQPARPFKGVNLGWAWP